MKNDGFEFSNDFLKKALGIIVFSFGVFMIIWSLFFKNKKSLHENSYNLSLESIYNSNYKGVVDYKDYNKTNHNNPTLYFSNGNSIINGDFWSIIKKGDSLVKNRNELFITVYRGNDKFILDYKPILEELKKNNK
ncbi:hypothetical protein [Flavobacterium columnare]|uniref:Uncharacterized protein n=1 Tax=Flavobacterium columnare TaxID=996 RepID=A0AA94F434_9FLAO|nr:hypothetical protein [Flavobacterium columnare]MCH4828451.1 hypothetical protein [Flavobacterium columnare]MCH4832280.1 hypothetical protein [Flavobacterium columnare]